jgi:hypothetical protein
MQWYLTFSVVWPCYHPVSLHKQSHTVGTDVSSTETLNYKSVFDGDVTNLGLVRIICLSGCRL